MNERIALLQNERDTKCGTLLIFIQINTYFANPVSLVFFKDQNLCFGYMYDLVVYVQSIDLGNLWPILQNMHTRNLIRFKHCNSYTFWH